MKFVMIREYDHDVSKDKIIIGEIVRDYYIMEKPSSTRRSTYKISLAYLSKMGSFKEDEEYNLLINTDSVQIRPKAIYKNDQGYYRKEDGKRLYLGDEHVKEVEQAIEKFKKYIEEHQELELTCGEYKEIL